MERIRTDIKPGGGSLHPVINQDAQPTRMSRTIGKGPGGNGNSLPPNKGRYGFNEGATLVRMSRKGGSSEGGKTFKLPMDGPGRAPRSASGSISHQGKTYGVTGVDGSGGKGFGVGGI